MNAIQYLCKGNPPYQMTIIGEVQWHHAMVPRKNASGGYYNVVHDVEHTQYGTTALCAFHKGSVIFYQEGGS